MCQADLYATSVLIINTHSKLIAVDTIKIWFLPNTINNFPKLTKSDNKTNNSTVIERELTTSDDNSDNADISTASRVVMNMCAVAGRIKNRINKRESESTRIILIANIALAIDM